MLRLGGRGVNLSMVTRTRARGGLSTAGFTGVAAARWGREPKPIREQPPQFAPKRHRLAQVVPEGGRRAATHGRSFPPRLRGGQGGRGTIMFSIPSRALWI